MIRTVDKDWWGSLHETMAYGDRGMCSDVLGIKESARRGTIYQERKSHKETTELHLMSATDHKSRAKWSAASLESRS